MRAWALYAIITSVVLTSLLTVNFYQQALAEPNNSAVDIVSIPSFPNLYMVILSDPDGIDAVVIRDAGGRQLQNFLPRCTITTTIPFFISVPPPFFSFPISVLIRDCQVPSSTDTYRIDIDEVPVGECEDGCFIQRQADIEECRTLPREEQPRCFDEAFSRFNECVLQCKAPREIQVSIDVKPGSDPSSVSCKNLKGNVPVVVITDNNFDATTIDIEIVSMNLVGLEPIQVTETHGVLHPEDVDDDGDLDAVLHLDPAGVCEAATDAPLKETVGVELNGETTDGIKFKGIGDIRIVNR